MKASQEATVVALLACISSEQELEEGAAAHAPLCFGCVLCVLLLRVRILFLSGCTS